MILKEILDTIKHIAIAIIVALVITKYIGQTAIVHQSSMQNTLFEGNVLWVEKLTPLIGTIKRGDIVTILAPKEITFLHGDTLIKRIIGIPGDHLEIKNGKIYINGSEIIETYIKGTTTTIYNENNNNIYIPKNKYYVLGDNRVDLIVDSRNIGLIDKNYIKSRAVFRLFPLNKIGSMIN